MANSVVYKAIKFVDDFPTLCEGDDLVYFKTPSKIGVGISRGSACCIFSKGQVIDFSGKPLNLTARLCDMARPLDVVFDESISSCIPAEELDKNFLNEKVYAKGVTDKEPITVYCTAKTRIPISYKRKPTEPEWATDYVEVTLEQLSSVTSELFTVLMAKTPLDENEIVAIVSFDESGGIDRKIYSIKDKTTEFKYKKTGKENRASFNRLIFIESLKKRNVKPEDLVKVEVTYPIKE
jgi:hypothetical protein